MSYKRNKKFAVLLGERNIVIMKVHDGERFNFSRLNPVGISPADKALLVYISASNKTMNNFNKLKSEIIEDNVFKKILVERSHSYIILANPQDLLQYFKNKEKEYKELLYTYYLHEENFIFE